MNIWIVEQFDDTELPKYEESYSKVSCKNISEKENKHAHHKCNHFNIKTNGWIPWFVFTTGCCF